MAHAVGMTSMTTVDFTSASRKFCFQSFRLHEDLERIGQRIE